MTTAFVLGGGGHRGAFEVGMLKALTAAGVEPDLVLGTSIGAINGAIFATEPGPHGADQLESAWRHIRFDELFPGGWWNRARSAVRQRTFVHGNERLRAWITDRVGMRAIDDLGVPFQCVAACIEDSAEVWFDSGPLVDAVLASAAVPGLLPPVEVDGRHYIDGGVVNSIPISRAYALGADVVYVLHVGHVDDVLEVPKSPWDVGVVAFEIARRHRFSSDLANVPEGTTVHVLPTGSSPGRFNDPAKLKYGSLGEVETSIATAYEATSRYLATA